MFTFVNAHDIIRIHYTKPTYNAAISYPQNYNRYAGIRSVVGKEEARKAVAELTAQGCIVRGFSDGCGWHIDSID